MRIGLPGGKPQVVLHTSGYTGVRPGTAPGDQPYGEGDPRFRCPTVPGRPCVLSETRQQRLVFTAFDPLDGRRGQLARVDGAFWDLSPDGRWIAFGTCCDAAAPTRIHLLSLGGEAPREIPIQGWSNLQSVAWAPDGSALFATGWASKGGPLLRVSLDGRAQLLYTAPYYLENPIPSPDGRLLAFGQVFVAGNVWILEKGRYPL